MLIPGSSFSRVCITVSLGWAIAAVFVGVGGCGGGGPERAVVSGTVTYQGKPISNGMIRFMPVATSQTPMAGAVIVDGNYKIEGHGGAPVGTFTVEVEAYRERQSRSERPTASRVELPSVKVPPEQYLPRRHNADSQLQVTIEPGSGRITKNFDLTD